MSASRLRKLAESREGAIKFIVVQLFSWQLSLRVIARHEAIQFSIIGDKSREKSVFLSLLLQIISTFVAGFGAPSPIY